MKLRSLIAPTLIALGLIGTGQASAQEKLTVWWVKGFYKAEDDALFAAIKKFEEKHKGVKVELSQYPVQDMIPKTVSALDSGSPPDVAYADVYDFQVTGKWAFENKLEDISSVIGPMTARFAPNTVETTFLYNDQSKAKAYYAFPIKQQTMHVEYWIDMLTEAGFKESDIPTTWKEYWNFWCEKVQPASRQKSGKRTFGIGMPMGVDSSDSFYSFLTFMDAYNVQLVSDSGKLLVDDPKVKAGLVGALTDYTKPYTTGCTPPSSTSWKDPDNNVAFHNKTTVMTHNATISIAAKWLDDMNNATLTPEQREEAKKNFTEHPHGGLSEQAGRHQDGLPHRREDRRGVQGCQEQGSRQGVRGVPDAGREPDALRRRLARPLVPGDQGRPGAAVLEGRSAPPLGVQPVRQRHGAVRIHEELQVHHSQQRERVGQGDEPHRDRQGSGRQGGRRDDRADQDRREVEARPQAARHFVSAATPTPCRGQHLRPGRAGSAVFLE